MGRDPHKCLRVKVWHERVFAYRHLQIDIYECHIRHEVHD